MNGSAAAGETNWLRLGGLAVLAVLLAVFFGWQSGEMTVPAAVTPPRASWNLPNVPEIDTAKDLAVLKERKPWGDLGKKDAAASAQAKAAPPEWRLAGVVDRPDGSYALIAVGKPPSIKYEYRAVGDKLPDGSTLIELSQDSATTKADDQDGTQTVHRLLEGAAPPKKKGASLVIDPPARQARRRPQAVVPPVAQVAASAFLSPT